MPYDVFLSYKTENANAVREVADCLIASGLAVWFAEYEITGDIYDDDVAVQAAIDAGVERSRHAVVFTNNRWARSTYCAREMTRIQQRIPASRTIEICIPSEDLPRTTWPVLRGVPFIEYSGRLEDVVAFINAQRWFTGALHVSRPPFSAGRATRQRMRFGITMDIGPLRDASSMQTLLSERERRFPG
ncbi:MAG: TIR domain-containing protein, partial [Acidobacteria bacterium]